MMKFARINPYWKIDNKALAFAMGVKQSRMSGWMTGAERIPVERAKKMAALTGIPLYELRPDVWDKPGESS